MNYVTATAPFKKHCCWVQSITAGQFNAMHSLSGCSPVLQHGLDVKSDSGPHAVI